MNKVQKAIKRLKQETAPNTYNSDFNKYECIKVLEDFIDLNTPKKVVWKFDDEATCPSCCKVVEEYDDDILCPHCKQRLDWSE